MPCTRTRRPARLLVRRQEAVYPRYMAKPVDKPTELETDEPEFLIYEEDLEESARDPRVKAFLEESYAKFKGLEAEGRIIY